MQINPITSLECKIYLLYQSPSHAKYVYNSSPSMHKVWSPAHQLIEFASTCKQPIHDHIWDMLLPEKKEETFREQKARRHI